MVIARVLFIFCLLPALVQGQHLRCGYDSWKINQAEYNRAYSEAMDEVLRDWQTAE